MKQILAGTMILFGALVFAQQPTSPNAPATTPPVTQEPNKDVGREMPPDTIAKEPSARDVQKQIEDKFSNEPGLQSADLKVKVTGKEVQIKGAVADRQQHIAARRIAESYAGARTIVDQIQVKP